MTEYQELRDEIAQAIADCDDDETAALADVVMPVVERELSRRDAVIEQIRALAEKWAAWVPDGSAPHPMYGAGQSATATGCAEELARILSALPSTEEKATDGS